MMTYETANDAIRHSAQYGEIAHCTDTPANREQLLAGCDDHCSGNGLEDYWSNITDSDDDRMLWRVNIETTETE